MKQAKLPEIDDINPLSKLVDDVKNVCIRVECFENQLIEIVKEIKEPKAIKMHAQAFKIIKGTQSARIVIMDNMPVRANFGRAKALSIESQKKYASMCIERHERVKKMEQALYKKTSTNNENAEKSSFVIAYQKAIIALIKKDGKYKKSNYNKRKKIRSSVIWDLAKNNFDETNTVYWTLTYKGNHATANDLTACLNDFKKFREKIVRKYEDFQYIATFAQQKNGNWHFHIICNIIELSEQKVCELWRFGKVKKSRLNAIKDIVNVTKYLVKNMQSTQDILQGKKGYLCSQNLTRSQVLRSWNEDEVEACIVELEQLKYLPKRILYDAESPAGAMVKLEYQDHTEVCFVPERNITSDTVAHIVESVTTRVTAESMKLPARTSPALIARKKKI